MFLRGKKSLELRRLRLYASTEHQEHIESQLGFWNAREFFPKMNSALSGASIAVQWNRLSWLRAAGGQGYEEHDRRSEKSLHHLGTQLLKSLTRGDFQEISPDQTQTSVASF